jgi:hypothetical protein
MVNEFFPDLSGIFQLVPNGKSIKMTKGNTETTEDNYDYSKIDGVFYKYANRK